MARRRISEDEAALWQAIAETAKPLKRRRKSSPKPASVAPVAATPVAEPAKRKPVAPARAPLPPPPPAPMSIELAHGASAGIDKRQAERFRRGKTPIEGRIDLHGRTQAEAHDDLHNFLTRASSAGKRCVLVITGKGMSAKGTPSGKIGILRENVPRWLNEPGLRRYILTFDYAEPQHGGEGALYVLLKRKK